MTSHLDDETLHPMVSTLLGGGPITTAPIKSYSRERMMELKTTKASMTRPENLSEDYNGEDGKFSPLKWLEHRWEIEGIKNRPMSKKIDSLCAGADENTGLSPQRRAFSSGCKAPADDKGRDGEYERLGGHGKNWRNGSTGGADKFASRGNDFKTSFQKGGQLDRGARGTDWKKDATTRGAKFPGRREERLTSLSGSEKLPEWADGPTTMDDMIELRGFDEPKKGKNKKNPKEKKEKEVPKQSENTECAGSRPSSTGMKTVEPFDDPAIAFSSGGALPPTDQELAALLGCLDIQKSSRKTDGDDIAFLQKSEESAAATSRLSRFFGKKSKSPELDAMLASDGGGNNENVANPMLAKLFGHSGGDNNASSSGIGDMKGGMRLEDLEKGIESKETSKVSPLQDPSQQAQLMHHLQKFAKQQAESQMQQHRQPTPPNNGAHHPQQMHHPVVHPGMPIIADPALLSSFAQNPMVLNAYVENQLQEALNAAIRANNGQQLPAQLHEQLRMASMRNKAFLQAQTLSYVTLQQQHQQNQMHLQQQHHQQKGRAPSMIPASVQRALHKSASNADQKKEKSSQSPPDSTQEAVDAQTHPEAAVNAIKKLQMQQNYANMVQAMNSGVGWNRGNGATNGQQQQYPPNVQMLMAQHQQAQMHHLKMMMSRAQQQHMLMAKLAHMQQQHQQHAQIASMQERQGSSHHQQQSVPSELSQVGPIQTPLEKLLASVGVQGSQFTGSGDRIPTSARPMSLEDLEKQLTAAQK
ncbi:CBN-PQN-45 protein [Caenorhabditis brenneri]|uniref:CBN-PQN-45 protein n=1 Tax=Caenorhabditis brenneri TaxID=135651 RepID=G0ME63_CAEBE|nr:CBN-PQN-45 protein [Caenorhabditis brenneri]